MYRAGRPTLEFAHVGPSAFEHMRVKLFGGVTVCVGKDLVLESQWHRPQSRILLAHLALAPNHTLTRYEILDALWPDASYERGRERLYTTVSALRCTIGQTAESEQYVLSERGRIWLDQTLVECDVDAFDKLSRAILAESQRPDDIVAGCLKLEKLYAAGLFLPAKDTTGIFKRRHKEYAERYENALTKGVSAARELGDFDQMQWFQSNIKALH